MCDFSEKKQKKGKNVATYLNIWKKGKKFENILKKGQPHACDYHMHETARICSDTATMYAQRIKGIIIPLRKTVYRNIFLHVDTPKSKNRIKMHLFIAATCQFIVHISCVNFMSLHHQAFSHDNFVRSICKVVKRTHHKHLPCYT